MPLVFAIEFKVGEKTFDRSAIDQVWDYALDLKNFHEASHNVSIVPMLVATEARNVRRSIFMPMRTRSFGQLWSIRPVFAALLDSALRTVTGGALDCRCWSRASYHPTPTIVEAARALYAHHSVEAIARFDAGAQNLHVTSGRIEELVDEARRTEQRLFVLSRAFPVPARLWSA